VLGDAMREHLPKCAAAGCAEREALREGMKELMEVQPLLKHDFTERALLTLEHGGGGRRPPCPLCPSDSRVSSLAPQFAVSGCVTSLASTVTIVAVQSMPWWSASSVRAQM
jgi:hypothetical protein